ncbi:MAG: hypothetical protein JST30_12680 [Armatimonadetes bacterium]|nr:hypothetical protein [Armatimonadota bacterium]
MTTTFRALGALIVVATAVTSHAGYYKLFGRANEQIFFGPSDNQQIEQTNGIKNWSGDVHGENNTDYAVGHVDVRFGFHRGSVMVEGLFSNAYCEARTEEDVTFRHPLGLPVTVQANLVGAASLFTPGDVSVMRAMSGLSINGAVRVFYEDKYIGLSHTTVSPQPFTFQVNSGDTVRVYQQTIFQVTGPSTDKLYFVSCNGGIQAELKVMTPMASMVSSTGSKYKPVVSTVRP